MGTRICDVLVVFDFCRLKPILYLQCCCVCVVTYVSLCTVNGMLYVCSHVKFPHRSLVFKHVSVKFVDFVFAW